LNSRCKLHSFKMQVSRARAARSIVHSIPPKLLRKARAVRVRACATSRLQGEVLPAYMACLARPLEGRCGGQAVTDWQLCHSAFQSAPPGGSCNAWAGAAGGAPPPPPPSPPPPPPGGRRRQRYPQVAPCGGGGGGGCCGAGAAGVEQATWDWSRRTCGPLGNQPERPRASGGVEARVDENARQRRNQPLKGRRQPPGEFAPRKRKLQGREEGGKRT
jgi:hypothetical protein